MKTKKKTHLNVLFGLAMVWVHPKTAKKQPHPQLVHWWVLGHSKLKRSTISFFSCQHLVFVDEVSHTQSFYVELLNSQKKSIKPREFIFMTNLCGTYGVELKFVFDENCSIFNNSLHRKSKHYETTSMHPTSLFRLHIPLRNFQCYSEHDKKRLDDLIPRDLIATNKTKQNKQPSFER